MENDENNSNNQLLSKRMRSAFKLQNVFKRIEDKMKYNCSGRNNEFFEMAVRLADLFGDDVVVDGLAIAENGLVRVVRDDEGAFPSIYEKKLPIEKMVWDNRNVLCVAEKHDAAKNIAKFLSNGSARTAKGRGPYIYNFLFDARFLNGTFNFVFTSVRGHLMNFYFHPRHKVWIENQIYDLFDGEILQSVMPDMKPVEENLRDEAKKAKVLIIWTDCDREGEHIGNEVSQTCLGANKNLRVYRARFSEITQQSITRAMQNLQIIDRNKVSAVECRMELDLRTGAAFTRLQTICIRKSGLHTSLCNGKEYDNTQVVSYGSCQFPTLGLKVSYIFGILSDFPLNNASFSGFVVHRYKEHTSFVSQQFWKLVGTDGNNKGFVFSWERDGLSVHIFDESIVQALKSTCNSSDKPAIVKEIVQKPKSKFRPQPLDTIQLERLGSRFLRVSAKQILSSAERLYQNGFVSYPRTETNCYSNEFDLSSIVQALTQNNLWGQFATEIQQRGGPRPRNGTKNDQAHPPIHPVKNATRAEITSNEDWNVYEFICRHFLASVSRDATGNETKVKVELADEIFVTTGLIIEDMGYLNIYRYENWRDKNIPTYRQGQILPKFSVDINNGFTEPPPLLTEADLIALMDKKGIGTDATHAEHIETIKKRWYIIQRPDRRFEPTKLGISLVDAYEKMEHTYKLSRPDLRAILEADLEKICRACSLLKPDRIENGLVMIAILNSISAPPENDPDYGKEEELFKNTKNVSDEESDEEVLVENESEVL
uniref:DNA topoisomerase n=1 Tax=Meloidogyne hapla TaxID=6305 RepID=A0A1I8AWP4_MELHA